EQCEQRGPQVGEDLSYHQDPEPFTACRGCLDVAGGGDQGGGAGDEADRVRQAEDDRGEDDRQPAAARPGQSDEQDAEYRGQQDDHVAGAFHGPADRRAQCPDRADEGRCGGDDGRDQQGGQDEFPAARQQAAEDVPAELVPAERGSGAGLGERRGDRCVHGVGGQPGAGDGEADEQEGREGAEERGGAVTDDPAVPGGRHHRTPPVTRPRTRSAASSAQVMTAPASAVTPATTGVSRSTTAEARTAPTPG